MSEYSGFILVNRNKLGPYILSDVTGCRGKLRCLIAQVPLYLQLRGLGLTVIKLFKASGIYTPKSSNQKAVFI